MGAFTVEVYPPYRFYCRVAYALFLRTPAAYPHFIRVSDPSADMTQNLVNQTFHRQDAARNGNFSPQFFHRLSHKNFPSLTNARAKVRIRPLALTGYPNSQFFLWETSKLSLRSTEFHVDIEANALHRN